MRRSLVIQLLVLCVVIGAISAAVAIFIPWMPELGSVEGGRIDDTYWLATIISLVIFTIVFSVSVYALLKFRAKPDDDEDGKPIHGHTTLEVIWTAIPTVLVTAIAVYSAVVLVKNEETPAGTPVIEVEAEQFEWSFTYPELGVTTGVLYVKQGEKIELLMTASDVIHSFWVPEWRVKQDRRPGNGAEDRRHADEDREVPAHLHRALRARPLDDAGERRRPLGSRLREVAADAAERPRKPAPAPRTASRSSPTRAAASATSSLPPMPRARSGRASIWLFPS